jgi:hypothetical protein
MLSVSSKPFMQSVAKLSVIMLSVIILIVVAPECDFIYADIGINYAFKVLYVSVQGPVI